MQTQKAREKAIKSSPCCEICEKKTDNFDHFRRHMQYLHYCIVYKIQLMCKKCSLTFYTERGLDIHMLASHGIVTKGMSEAAGKGKDSGMCPICKVVREFFFFFYILFLTFLFFYL